MKPLALIVALCLLGLLIQLPFLHAASPPAGPPEELGDFAAVAEKHYAEGSYARAHELYKQLAARPLTDAQKRWVDFRLPDTRWRAQAATRTHDDTIRRQALKELEALVRDVERAEDRDLIWAEVHESLGDFFWITRHVNNWSQAWPHYEQALDYWAGVADIETARSRYLEMVWKMTAPPWRGTRGRYYSAANPPLNILENAAKIAQQPQDRARAHFLLALGLRNSANNPPRIRRVAEEFEAAIALGPATEWYDDALYYCGEWFTSRGRIIMRDDGTWRQRPDYVKAVQLFRRITSEFEKGRTAYYDDAKNQIEHITRPEVGVHVGNIFLPGSLIQYYVNWRNVDRLDLALHSVDLTRDTQITGDRDDIDGWLESIDIAAAETVRTWDIDTEDKSDHVPGSAEKRLDEKLPLGAYVLTASASGKTVRDLVLVTDLAVVFKTTSDKVLAYVCDAGDGSPVADARVRVWAAYWEDRDRVWRAVDAVKQTDEHGMCFFTEDDLPRPGNDSNQTYYFAAASIGDRQAIAESSAYYRHSYRPDAHWRIYAFTDRPAYRPDETVRWKFIARTYDGSTYSTPGEASVYYEINDPRGAKIASDTVTLNGFGSAAGEVALTREMPLGEYNIAFYTPNRSDSLGRATLFRLEEYKLPEFRVSVSTPEEDGKKKFFRLGDEVDVTIEAEYYFGGPVADASVEIVINQSNFAHYWRPPRDFPWCYDEQGPHRYFGYGEQLIKRETLKTDAEGRATVTFETPYGSQQDFQYRIEARVTDASRREIIGSDTVRVTRQRYYVYAHPKHNLYRPNDKVEIDFKSLDANNEPVEVAGIVKVTRQKWVEVWIDPQGREVTGLALEEARKRHRVFPPPTLRPDDRPWRVRRQEYMTEEVLSTQTVKTNAEGEATLAFTPQRDGYYRITWVSEDAPGPLVRTETMVWVADNATTEIGYRHGGLEIIADKDTFRAGQTAPVMINTPTNDRYVLFSVEGDDLHSYELVHVNGTVKLVQLPIAERHVPNFYLAAAMVTDAQIFSDLEQITVPPVKHFLDVEVISDREEYQPGEEGQVTIITRDQDGKPVSAEVSLGVVDESVYYIQSDYAGDPRPYFFDQRQYHLVNTASTFNIKSYVRLVEFKDDRLVDERMVPELQRRDREAEMLPSGGARGRAELHAGYGGGGAMRKGGSVFGEPADAEMIVADSAFRGGRMAAKSMAPPGPAAAGEELGMQRMPPGENGEPAVRVRSDFRSTIFWQPDITTDSRGKATVGIDYADSLTAWKGTARAATTGNQFGIGYVTTRTKMPLMARLQAPRFFVVGDVVTVSAIINNNTDEPMTVNHTLQVDGLQLNSSRASDDSTGTSEVPANGEKRIDWLVTATEAGEAKLTITAKSGKYADAMEKTYSIHEHGVDKLIAKSGKVRGDDVTIKLDIPAQRRKDSTTLTVQVTPSMAVTMLDALPYLIEYPYGCTEQTMSRFLPAAITAKTLTDLGLDPADAMSRVFGGIEQQFADKTHTRRKRDLAQLDLIVQKNLERLYDFQHSDGGWGWWKRGDSDHFMTAYVLWGMSLATQADRDVRTDVMQRAAAYLELEIVEAERQYDLQAWMLHAVSAYAALGRQTQHPEYRDAAFENLWRNRDALNAYTRALLALTAHYRGDAERAGILIANLENGVKRDRTPDTSIVMRGDQQSHDAVIGTAHWGEDGIYWRWSQGGVESTAFALRALLAIDPDNELIEPVTNWLIKNRRGAQWSNTRDTAIALLALNDYLRTSGELAGDLEYQLHVNGEPVSTKSIAPADVLAAPSRFVIDNKLIRDGVNDIRIVRTKGTGPLYFAAEAAFFSLEEPIPPAGNEIFVRREYFKLVPRPTLLKGVVYDRVPMADGDSVVSGERVEVVITVEGKNNYEYLVFEDLKPAGLEAVEIRSGESLFARELKSGGAEHRFGGIGDEDDRGSALADVIDYTGRQRWVYQELRDRKVAMFIDRLPEGIWEIRYELRAEAPGSFHALPVLGHAMYVPEIRCNGAEIRMTVEDRED
ncbi:MAG: hypothetical protein JSV91_07965 [Phycisphaerales bacterium]|nr:MAG: hypothetical protein JSV91_07965 [Phycisphaerales bacterium]